MADTPKTRGLTDEQWGELRRAYEAGDSIVSLSKRFGVSRPTIMVHRDRGAWILQPSLQCQLTKTDAKSVRERATAQVIDIATKRAVEKIEQSGGLDEQVAAVEDLLRMQAPLYAKAAKLINVTLDKAISGELRLGVTQGETTAVTDILNALSKFSKDTRTGAGLRDGTPTVNGEGEVDQRVDEIVLVVRDRAQSA